MQPTPPTATLTLIRDASISVEDLARRLHCSEIFAAALIDSVTGTADFRSVIEWCEESEAGRKDYRDGFAAGEALLDAESGTDTWTDAPAPALAVVCCDGCPF